LNILHGVWSTATELNHSSGVTSNLQTQLNAKAATSHTHTASQITDFVSDKAKLTKNTLGHTSAGGAYAATTWVKVTGFNVTNYSNVANGAFTVDATNGAFNIAKTGYYDIEFLGRWQSYGSVNGRSMAICSNASAPATDASNVIAVNNYETGAWLISTLPAQGAYLAAGANVTFWIRSATTSTFNAVNTAIPGWTYIAIKESR
jgi:hypothetical protein